MRTIVIGLGVQGNKRQLFAGKDFQFSIDPLNDKATFKNLDSLGTPGFLITKSVFLKSSSRCSPKTYFILGYSLKISLILCGFEILLN